MQIPTHVWFIVGCHLRDCWLTVQRNNKVRYHTNRFKLINDALKMRSVYVAVTTFKQQCDSLACFVFAFGRQTTWFPVVQHISMENHCKVLSESACVSPFTLDFLICRFLSLQYGTTLHMLAIRLSDYPVVFLRGFICGRASVTILKGFAETFRIIVNYYAFCSQFYSTHIYTYVCMQMGACEQTKMEGFVGVTHWKATVREMMCQSQGMQSSLLLPQNIRSMISIWDNCTLRQCNFLLLCSVVNDYANIAVEC